MTWNEAIGSVIAATGIERYRWLCSDENRDAEQREAYRALMVRQATGEVELIRPTQAPVQSKPDPWLVLIRACEDWNPGCCAHPSPSCTRFAKNVTREECIECLTEQGIIPPAGTV